MIYFGLKPIAKFLRSNNKRLGFAGGMGQIISQLFANNEQGFAFDFNDLSSMYQDAAGTIPVTGAGQPVGLVLDKSKGLVGPELVTNGTFNTDTTGWSSAPSFASTASAVGGVMQVTAQAVYGRQIIPISVTVGKTYLLTGSIRAVSGTAALGFAFANGSTYKAPANETLTTSTTFVAVSRTVVAWDSTIYVFAGNQTNGQVAEFDNISVRELPGNHATQSTSAKRPLLQQNATTGAYYLAFDGVDDSLQTSNIDLSTVNQFSLFSGVRKLSDSAQIVTEFSTSGWLTTGGFYLLSGTDSGGNGYTSLSNSSAPAKAFTFVAPDDAVLSTTFNRISQISTIRRNAVAGTNGGTGTGNLGNYPLYIGARTGTAYPFSGHLYSLIGVARVTNNSEIVNVEKAIARNIGVVL